MSKLLRFALLLSPMLALLVGGGWYLFAHVDEPLPPDAVPPVATRPAGRLVVVVVFDQMRGDYLTRWAPLFGDDGFEKVKREGAWYSNTHLPYACSSTGPGHASIGSGVPPAIHGVIENSWYDRKSGKDVYGAKDIGVSRIPRPDPKSKEVGSLSPERLLVPGVGARVASIGGRVFSLSLKDRAAVLMAGKCKDAGVYCFDSDKGEFHTSSHYRNELPPWAEKFNATNPADRWFRTRWERLKPAAVYDANAGPDFVEAEGRGVNGMGREFPHPLAGTLPQPGKPYYDAVETSAFGNDLLWGFAKECIAGERLGQKESKDLLYLSFSSNDMIGHVWGPDSHEVLDVTLRSDRLLADMIRHLDETVGRDRYTLVVTADHGVCPLPELTAAKQPGVERFLPDREIELLGRALDQTFGPLDDASEAWVSRLNYPDLYLNTAEMDRSGKPRADVERFAAQWIGNRPHLLAAFPRSLLAGPPLTDPLARKVQLGWHPDRSGDVVIVHQPFMLPGKNAGGYSVAGHGSPHPYDTHVPLLAFGADVPALKERSEPTSSLAVAAVVCQALGIDPPAPLPAGWK